MFIYFIFQSHIFQNGTSEMTGMLECSTIGPNWNGDRNSIYNYDIICHLFHWRWWICMWRVHYIWDGFGTIYFVDCEWQHIWYNQRTVDLIINPKEWNLHTFFTFLVFSSGGHQSNLQLRACFLKCEGNDVAHICVPLDPSFNWVNDG